VVTWCYDGSLEGFWTLVARSYTHRLLPDRILCGEPGGDLFGMHEWVACDEVLAARAAHSFAKRVGQGHYNRISDALRVISPPLIDLLLFVRVGFKDPKALHDRRCAINRAVNSAGAFAYREAHRQIGFVRFEQWRDGTLYAPIGPQAAVLDLIAPHFQSRMAQEKSWVIHDRKREEALVFAGGALKQVQVEALEAPRLDDNEQAIQALWRRFFDRVSIEERKSPKRQRQLVPRRFEPYMTEMA
jgi:probable DNA metabolism protein